MSETQSRVLLGTGILTWDGAERRSNRYGMVILSPGNYNDDAKVTASLDAEVLSRLAGCRVRLEVEVIETRESGHLGDLFLGIHPTTPDVGECIDLGVGIFQTTPCDWTPTKQSFGLKPGDGRAELWLDPRSLYRLHDQTVKVYATLTNELFTAAPVLKESDGAIAVLGGVQVKKSDLPRPPPPTITPLGGGMFTITQNPLIPGTRLK
jgi:hypothetical protein